MNQESSQQEVHRQWGRLGQSLLNSMIGEYLEKEKNPLAIQMGFYHQSKRLSLDSSLAMQLDFPLSNKVVVFVHGMTNLETVWEYPAEGSSNASIVSHYIDMCFDATTPTQQDDYGTQLKREFGYTPLYLRYNTGLSLEKNGRNFAAQLTKLFKTYPIAIDDLMLVGFSMGGSLLTHAQYAAQKSDQPWLKALSKCMYLGNPNEGNFLANLLQLGSDFLRHIRVRHLSFLADWFDQRSKQIRAHDHLNPRRRLEAERILFHASTRHYFINGNLNKNGDKGAIPAMAPTHSQNAHIEGISPIRLTHSDRVYHLISTWVREHKPVQHQESPELVHYSPYQASFFETNRPCDSSNKAFIAGTVDLVASAYDRTVQTVETMHYSIAEEPFGALEKLPIASQIAKPVEAAQRDMLDNIYRSLRSGGRMMHQFAADMASNDAEPKKVR